MKILIMAAVIALSGIQASATDSLKCTCDAFGKEGVDELSISLSNEGTKPITEKNGCLLMESNGLMIAVSAGSESHPRGFEASFNVERLKSMEAGDLGRYVIHSSDPMANNGNASFLVRCSIE